MTKNITLALPDETHNKMRQFQEIRWSEIARQAIEKRLSDLEEIEKIASKSKLTEEDIRIFSKKVKRLATERLGNASRH